VENPGYIEKNNGSTPLMFSCQTGLINVSSKIIATGESKPNHINNGGMSALAYACQSNLLTVVQRLTEITDFEDSTESKNIKNMSIILTLACKHGMNDLALKILNEIKNLNLNELYFTNSSTPLIYACKNNSDKVIRELIKRKDIEYGKVDHDKTTALMCALKNGVGEDIIMIFINSGVPTDGALFYATQNKMKQASEALALIETKGYPYYFAKLNDLKTVTTILDNK